MLLLLLLLHLYYCLHLSSKIIPAFKFVQVTVSLNLFSVWKDWASDYEHLFFELLLPSGIPNSSNWENFNSCWKKKSSLCKTICISRNNFETCIVCKLVAHLKAQICPYKVISLYCLRINTIEIWCHNLKTLILLS